MAISPSLTGRALTCNDTDVCTDAYGLPFIPAKRIRGCLRECALELNDWGDSIDIEKIFGDKGSRKKAAGMRLSNAFIKDYEEYKSFIVKNKGHVLVHPQNVTNVFSYIRSQTSINYDTGVAEDNSLRTMRVVNKGLEFEARAEIEDAYYNEFVRCCSILRHMGLARTRGLGEVKVSVRECGESVVSRGHAELTSDAVKLSYEIELLEPVICKSVNGGESNTLDYIDGAKMLGLISEHLSEDYIDFMSKGGLKCSNAYISEGGKRFTEVPGYIYKIKNNKKNYVNKLAETECNKEETKGWQLNQMKHCYAVMEESKLSVIDVITEERYHHRRPDDKSIGRAAAKEDGDADFYQMDSISAGQTFIGYVTGSTEQIKEVYDILTKDKYFYIGYSKSSEYGKVRIRVIKTMAPEIDETIKTDEIVACLKAPTIVYNENAMPTTDPEVLAAEIGAVLGIRTKPDKVDRFIRNITLGGYNVTWDMKKPTIQAFDKGTALRLHFSEPVTASAPGQFFIGERNAEGFGEAELIIPKQEDAVYVGNIKNEDKKNEVLTINASSEFASKLAEPLIDSFVRRKAVDAVERQLKDINRNKSVYKPTVSNMILMLKSSTGLRDIKEAVEDRYISKRSGTKEEKARAAKAILREIESAVDIQAEFTKETGISGLDISSEELQMKYLREYLTQVKYRLRGE